ncbi:MAG: hypothetical protein IJA00_08380 [Bacteroidaceae bacterium]|nr:hypothetical protein [Bacteroidaceae bacterium]
MGICACCSSHDLKALALPNPVRTSNVRKPHADMYNNLTRPSDEERAKNIDISQ